MSVQVRPHRLYFLTHLHTVCHRVSAPLEVVGISLAMPVVVVGVVVMAAHDLSRK